MHSPKQLATAALLSMWLACSLMATVSCQDMPQTSPDDSTRDWKIAGNDTVLLLVRKVDEKHAYFKSLMFRKPGNKSEALATLTRLIAENCNTSNITRLVKNDLLVLRSPCDVAGLVNGDRIEAWSKRSGPPSRARTAMASARPQRPSDGSRPPRPPGPPGPPGPPPMEPGQGGGRPGRPGRPDGPRGPGDRRRGPETPDDDSMSELDRFFA